MAAAEHKLSRRALLGAAFAVPALGADTLTRHPGLGSHQSSTLMGHLHPGSTFSLFPPTPEGRWMPDRARHDEEGDVGDSFAVTKWDRALARFRRAEAALAAVAHTEDDNLYDRVLGRFNDALRRLLRSPAPNVAALAAKLGLAVRHLAWELTGGEACMAALLRDARRLAAIHSS